MSTIDSQIRTGHETAPVAEQEEDRRAKLIYRAQAEEHVVSYPLGLHAGLLQGLGRRRRPDVSGRQRIHADQWHRDPRTPFGGK